jgi:glucose-6-phosphate 1-epimerase
MADTLASCVNDTFQGQPCLRLALPGGDTAVVALHGATVISWVSGGRERLFLSARSHFNGRDAIRGGVPVCWPQFNARGNLQKHGFARNMPWVADAVSVLAPDSVQATLRLSSSAATLALWPQSFQAQIGVTLTPGGLRVALGVHNTDTQPLAFSGALHTYFAVDNIAQAQLDGLGGQPEWDALTDANGVAADALRFDGNFDRVYGAAPASLTLHAGSHRLSISQSPEWAHTVVWTPGAANAAQMADMEPEGHQRMLCVEAAQVMQPTSVPAGGVWQGWQQMNVI